MFDQALSDIKAMAVQLGMRVEGETEDEVELYLDEEWLCYLWFDEDDETWMESQLARDYRDAEELLRSVLSHHNHHKRVTDRQASFSVTLEYKAAAPKLTVDAVERLIDLIAEAAGELLPTNSKLEAVIVNDRRRRCD